MRDRRRRVLALVAVAAMLSLGACAGTSATSELAEDPSDETIAGPAPTAPPADPDAGLSATGVDMLEQLSALTQERDLCSALSSDAFMRLLTDDFDTTAMVTSPAGVTRLVSELNVTFAHLVTIAPPDLSPAVSEINDAWRRIVLVNPNLPDAEARVRAISEEPQLLAAQEAVGTWIMFNCAGAAAGLGS